MHEVWQLAVFGVSAILIFLTIPFAAEMYEGRQQGRWLSTPLGLIGVLIVGYVLTHGYWSVDHVAAQYVVWWAVFALCWMAICFVMYSDDPA